MPVFKVEISLSDGGTETVEVNAPDETEAEKVALTLIRSKDNPQTDREDLVKKITKISDKDFEMDENQLRKWAGLPERRIDEAKSIKGKIGNHTVEILATDKANFGPFGSNKVAAIKFDGKQYEVFRQGMINIWAFPKRPSLSDADAKEFDKFMDANWKK